MRSMTLDRILIVAACSEQVPCPGDTRAGRALVLAGVQLVAVQLGLLRSYELHTHDRNGASGGRGLVEAHA